MAPWALALGLVACSTAESAPAGAPDDALAATSLQGVTCVNVENVGPYTDRVEDAPIVIDPADPTKANINYGSVQQMNVGYVGTDYRRVVMKFNLGAVGVPIGSTVSSATLTFRMIQSLGKQPVDIYAGSALWSEASVTWNQLASRPGGGLGALQVSVPMLGVVNNTNLSVTLSNALVATWTDPSTNYGLVFDHPLPGRTNVASSEAPNTAPRPKLAVCYTPPACSDGVQGPGELGVDCGGVCPLACPSCSDGLQNQGELGVDCGGPCPSACPTCTDGLQNQGEGGVDCGGPCPLACPTCTDALQNQGETGVDCGGPCGPCACLHPTCAIGQPLDPACADPCAASVCAADAFCCTDAWDYVCVGEVATVCGAAACEVCGDGLCDASEGCSSCPADCGVCACAHDACSAGAALDPGCSDPCVAAVCAASPGCCATAWDAGCVDAVLSVCGSSACTCGDGLCQAGEACETCPSDCGLCACSHAVCTDGAPLAPGCDGDPCVTSICGVDPYCCAIAWDTVCVEEVQTICGQPACFACGDLACGGGEDCGGCPGDCGVCPGCGNGVQNAPEACDDGNTSDGDGCSSLCQKECVATEAEPNGSTATANGPLAPGAGLECGSIAAPGDVDHFSFVLAASSDVELETFDSSGVSCTGIDTHVLVYDATGALVTRDDDGGDGFCSFVTATLPAGTYYAAVHEFGDDSAIAGYRLRYAVTAVCGDGVVAGTEACDDGNTSDGDSCPATCRGPAPSPSVPSAQAVVTPTGGVPHIGSCPLFPSDNPWNTDISAYPVHPRSDVYISAIAQDFTKVQAGLNNPVGSVVTSAQPKVIVECTPGVGYCPQSDLYSGGAPVPLPIPPDAEIENLDVPTSDRHVWVIDTDACVLYELFHANRILDSDGSAATTNDPSQITGSWHWRADSAAIYDLTSNALRPYKKPGASASGLPLFPGLIKYEEVAAGAIHHALFFAVPRTQLALIAPATSYASVAADPTNPTYPPMGLRVRLKASYDTSAFYGQARVIVEAMKTYGMFVAENGPGSIFPTGSTGPMSFWKAYPDLLQQLNRIPVSAFEVVDTGTLQY
jgi:cysteine-rich repeat protein